MDPIDITGKITDYKIHLNLLNQKDKILKMQIVALKVLNSFFPFFRLKMVNKRIERFKVMVDARAKQEYIKVLNVDLDKYRKQKEMIEVDMGLNFVYLIKQLGEMVNTKDIRFDRQMRDYFLKIRENYEKKRYANDEAKIQEYLMLRDIGNRCGIKMKQPPMAKVEK